ncbi:MAG: hypothetical protein U5K56_17035 [Halioglobus sp.]|nr:hypothetical protein [Halioglobus sp.]
MVFVWYWPCALLPMYLLSDTLFSVFFPAYTESPDLFRILFLGAIVTLLFHPLYLDSLRARSGEPPDAYQPAVACIRCLSEPRARYPELGATGAAWATVDQPFFCGCAYLLFRLD